MKRLIIIILVVIAFAFVITFDVMAGGDKVRGDNGAGEVHQYFVVPPPWAN